MSLPRKWPCPGCGKTHPYKPIPAPRPCRECRLDADRLLLALTTLSRMPIEKSDRRDGRWQWLKGVLHARRMMAETNGNGPQRRDTSDD